MKNVRKILFMMLLLVMVLGMAGAAPVTAQAAGSAAQTTGSKTSGKWVTSNGKIKYKNANGKYVVKKFKKINGYWYYFDADGYIVTGLRTINNKNYYFSSTGKAGVKGRLLTGWRKIRGKKYYFRTSGKSGVIGSAYKSEWVTIDGVSYYFNIDGSLNSNTMTEEEFIEKIGKLAKKDMKKSGILASVTTAQAILESGYGTTSLAMEAHNLFGMKASLSNNTWKSAWKGKTFSKSTKEYLNKKWYTITDTFRSYNTFAESLTDHSAYLTGAMNGSKLRYAGVVGNKSYKKTVRLIKKGGYATDPEYVSKLCKIIKKYNLTRFDR